MVRQLLIIAFVLVCAAACGSAPVAHPVPSNMAWVEVDVAGLRGTQAWETHAAPWEAALPGMLPGAGDVMKRCDLDLAKVSMVSVAVPVGDVRRQGMVVIEGDFDAPGVLDCVRPSLKELGEASLAGRDGFRVGLLDRTEAVVVALSDTQLLAVRTDSATAVEAVLTGESKSVAETAFYRDAKAARGSDVVISAVLAQQPQRLPSGAPDMLGMLRAASVAVALPGGGLDAEVRGDLGDADSASQTANMLPLGLMFAGDQLGPLGPVLTQHLKTRAEGSLLILGLKLDAAGLDALLRAL